MRSLLFVPADSERKLAKGRESEADALILDLEDSVAAVRRPEARKLAHAFLAAPRTGRQRFYVRINPLADDTPLEDLAAVMPGKPDGIMLPKATPDGVRTLAHYLAAFEAATGSAPGATGIVAIATETPGSVFELGGYRGASPRLEALTWGAEDLAAVIGCANRKPDGSYDDVFRLARSLCILAAGAAESSAIREMTREQIDNYLRQAERVTGGYIYLKQWLNWENALDGHRVSPDTIKLSDSWARVFDRTDAIQTAFFERLWRRQGSGEAA